MHASEMKKCSVLQRMQFKYIYTLEGVSKACLMFKCTPVNVIKMLHDNVIKAF